MCGIVGCIGQVNTREFLINGLYSLEYRGYDSAGVCFLDENKNIELYKAVGKVNILDQKTPKDILSSLGIGHTRWATHGSPNLDNSHPHVSMHGDFVIVHNGVIENFRYLRNRLAENGYTFKSDTDTEVIANLIEFNFKRNRFVLDAIKNAIDVIEGSFALAIIYKNEENRLYFAKRNSPLVIGVKKDASFLSSDYGPIGKYSHDFICLNDNEYGYICENEQHIYKDGFELKKEIVTLDNFNDYVSELGDYPNYMLKEIEESPMMISRLIDNYFDGEKFLFDQRILNAIRRSDDIVFIACGTSYHASLMGVKYMQYLGKRSEAYIASEWAYFPTFTAKRPLYILISQSGETADLIRCQKIINSRSSINIAITNTLGSAIERNATYSLLLYAGKEVAVASTKAFSAQIALLAMLTGAVERKNNVITHLKDVKTAMNQIIEKKNMIKSIANEIADKSLVFFIGRGNDYNASLEASLKLKEVSYIHSEAFPGGELKHGPIALVDTDTALVAFNSDMACDLAIRNNVEEIETRGAKAFVISSEPLFKKEDVFHIPVVKEYLSIIPMVFVSQYLAYYVALKKGVDIDKPRNLAKSVTVE